MIEKKHSLNAFGKVTEAAWRRLEDKQIYFGHQSVGYNIIEGINDCIKDNPRIRLRISETNDPGDFNGGVLGHSRVGKNTDPKSKCDAFASFVEKGIGDKADIAFFKFCYVDITPGTDPQGLFSYYRSTLEQLKQKYPKTTFVHFTVPLTARQTGIKAWIKKIIGRPVWGVEDNIRRNQFNELLKKEYQGREPIFDLAVIESSLPDGGRALFTNNGKAYHSLAPEYTRDGGHLNEKGRKFVAEHLLVFLVNLSK